ncbi:MAG: hypothetical protein GKR89_27335 [Candidatus Latescibacteria bacterium]|nr:hypothetical protein [Candidatus Latescibacterota bacterium]
MQANKLFAKIKNQGVTHVVGVPDNGSRALYERLWEDADIEVVLVSREGEAFALASGLYLGGQQPLVIIQNTGFLEAGDAFRGTAFNMGIPLVMLMGYRGYKTMEPGAERVDTAATFFEPTLKAWNIPYSIMHSDADMERVDQAFAQASQTLLPVAVLFPGELE